MGHYTTMYLNVTLNIDPIALEELISIAEAAPQIQRTVRYHMVLRGAGGRQKSFIRMDQEGDTGLVAMVVVSSIKNQTNDYEVFLHWLAPYIIETGFIGYFLDETEKLPKLIMKEVDGTLARLTIGGIPAWSLN